MEVVNYVTDCLLTVTFAMSAVVYQYKARQDSQSNIFFITVGDSLMMTENEHLKRAFVYRAS